MPCHAMPLYGRCVNLPLGDLTASLINIVYIYVVPLFFRHVARPVHAAFDRNQIEARTPVAWGRTDAFKASEGHQCPAWAH